MFKVLKRNQNKEQSAIPQIRSITHLHSPPCPNTEASRGEKALCVTALRYFTVSYSSFGAAH